MLREAYKVEVVEPSVGETGDVYPRIIIVDITDPEGVSWREAKKQLRQWYIDKAKSLRSIKEKTYFG